MEELILFCLCVSLVFLGAAIIRVGMRGRYLGSLKLVWNVRKYPTEPRSVSSLGHCCIWNP